MGKVVLLCHISRKMELVEAVKEIALGMWDLKMELLSLGAREALRGNTLSTHSASLTPRNTPAFPICHLQTERGQ